MIDRLLPLTTAEFFAVAKRAVRGPRDFAEVNLDSGAPKYLDLLSEVPAQLGFAGSVVVFEPYAELFENILMRKQIATRYRYASRSHHSPFQQCTRRLTKTRT